MLFRLLLAVLFSFANRCASADTIGFQQFNILVLYSGSGVHANRGNLRALASVWQQRLTNKTLQQSNVYATLSPDSADPAAWPLQFNFTFHDVQSDIGKVQQYIYAPEGVLNSTTQPIHLIIGPEDTLGLETATLLQQYFQMPDAPSPISIVLPVSSVVDAAFYNNSILILPPPARKYDALLQQYAAAGAKSIAVIGHVDDIPSEDLISCGEAAGAAGSYGLQVAYNATIDNNTSFTQIDHMLSILSTDVQPDLVIWCQRRACIANSTAAHPMQHFQRAGYMPPGLSLPGCVEQNSVIPAGVDMRFVTAPVYTDAMVMNKNYNEETTVYSSQFQATSTSNATSLGRFYDFYHQLTGLSADDDAVAVWASFDLVEAVAYRLTQTMRNVIVGLGPPYDQIPTAYQYDIIPTNSLLVSGYMQACEIATPLGVVILDSTGVNTAGQSLLLQLDNTGSKQLVAPSTVATSSLVYPAPAFAERQYQWSLWSSKHQLVSTVTVCLVSVLLLCFCVTSFVQRQHPEIRMLHWGHISASCITSISCCAGLLVTWQADNNAAQCAARLWVTWVPAAFTLALIDIKAYRLSLFLRNQALKPPSFSHNKALLWTLTLTALSSVVVGVAVAVGHENASVVVIDINRPSINYRACNIAPAATSILTALGAVHVLVSVLAVLPVRNGVESFRDGSKLKDSMTAFYTALLLVWIVSLIGMDAQTLYVFRTVTMSIGFALLHTLMLGSRMVKFWLGNRWHARLLRMYAAVQMWTAHMTGASDAVTTRTQHESASILPIDVQSPLYDATSPSTESIQRMWTVLQNPERRKLFEQVARDALATESIEFIDAVQEYRISVTQVLYMSVDACRSRLAHLASKLHCQFVRVGAEKEINISSTAKLKIETAIRALEANQQPIIPIATLQRLLEEPNGNAASHLAVYDFAIHEVGMMMYQNLWSKFTAAELRISMVNPVAG